MEYQIQIVTSFPCRKGSNMFLSTNSSSKFNIVKEYHNNEIYKHYAENALYCEVNCCGVLLTY